MLGLVQSFHEFFELAEITAFHHFVAMPGVFRDDGVAGIPGVRRLGIEPVQVPRALPDGLENPRPRRVIVVATVAEHDHAGPFPDVRAPLAPEALQHHAVVGMAVEAHRAGSAVDVTGDGAMSGADSKMPVTSSIPSTKTKLRTRENSDLIV